MSLNNNESSLSHKCLIRIQSVYDTLKTAERKVADFMLAKPETIAQSSIFESAKQIGCSEATLVRFARKLGFSGYPELKTSILKNESETTVRLYNEISSDEDEIGVVNNVFKNSIQSLMDTLSVLDSDEYKNALSVLTSSDRILFVGAGDAYTVAYAGYLKFSRIGLNARCSKDFDVQLIEASKLSKTGVLLAVSHSGRTQTIYDVIKCAKFSGASVITITNYPTSPIARLADIVLLTATFVPNMVGEIMTKRIPELCILESLYVNMVMRVDSKYIENLNFSNEIIAAKKM